MQQQNNNPNAIRLNLNEGNQPQSSASPTSQTCGLFITSLIFATCFGVFTNDSEKYGSVLCEKTAFMTWCKAAFIHNLVILGCTVLIFPCMLKAISNAISQGQGVKGPLMCFNIVQLGLGITSFTIFIGLCVTYGDNDPCGQLRDLALAYIILSGIGLGIAGIAVCCLCMCGCLMGGAILTAKLGSNANANPAQQIPSVPNQDVNTAQDQANNNV